MEMLARIDQSDAIPWFLLSGRPVLHGRNQTSPIKIDLTFKVSPDSVQKILDYFPIMSIIARQLVRFSTQFT